MNLTVPENLDTLALSRLIQKAKEVEASRDLDVFQAIFKPVWENIELEPDFSAYNDLEKAELFRLSGYFVYNYGKTKNVRHYQERAKNLLTNSIKLFSQLNLTDRASEATVILALCYLNEGAMIESEAILEQVAESYHENHLHPVYLRAYVNWLIVMSWKSEFQKALDVIAEIEIPIEFSNDANLKYLFHTQAGIIYRRTDQLDKAIYQYNQAIETAQKLNYWVGVATNLNNLAFLYKHIKDFEAAHYQVEKATAILREKNLIGWLPHAIDTKALIYFAENKLELALQTFDEAISILEAGEDYGVLIDSIWNKVRCLLALDRKDEAILLFTRLTQLAQIHVGEIAVKKYAKSFADIIYVKQSDESLDDELARFKKKEIVNALRQSNYNIEEAAKSLGYAKPRKFITTLNNEFPEIYEELGVQTRITPANVRKVSEKTKAEVSAPKLINQLQLKTVCFAFDKSLNIKSNTKISTFYISSEKIPASFNIFGDAVAAIVPLDQMRVNDWVIIKNTAGYSLACILYDDNLNIFYLMDGDEPFSFDEIEIVGKVVGYSSFEEVDDEKLTFKPFMNQQTV